MLATYCTDRPLRWAVEASRLLSVSYTHLDVYKRQLQHRQGGARVAVGEARNHAQRVRRKLYVHSAKAARVLQGAAEQQRQILLAQGVEDKDPAAGQQLSLIHISASIRSAISRPKGVVR